MRRERMGRLLGILSILCGCAAPIIGISLAIVTSLSTGGDISGVAALAQSLPVAFYVWAGGILSGILSLAISENRSIGFIGIVVNVAGRVVLVLMCVAGR